jgi:hypothetical protein
LALSAAAVVLAVVIVLPMLFRIPGFGTDTPTPSTPTPTQPAVVLPTTGTSEPAPTTQVDRAIVRLAVGSGSVVDVVIDDPDGLIDGGVAEQGDQTMSVRWFDSIVEEGPNPGTIRVLWVGFPRDEDVTLKVSQKPTGTLTLHFIQAGPPLNSDGEGEDRVLVLTPEEPIDPSDVEVTFETP